MQPAGLARNEKAEVTRLANPVRDRSRIAAVPSRDLVEDAFASTRAIELEAFEGDPSIVIFAEGWSTAASLVALVGRHQGDRVGEYALPLDPFREETFRRRSLSVEFEESTEERLLALQRSNDQREQRIRSCRAQDRGRDSLERRVVAARVGVLAQLEATQNELALVDRDRRAVRARHALDVGAAHGLDEHHEMPTGAVEDEPPVDRSERAGLVQELDTDTASRFEVVVERELEIDTNAGTAHGSPPVTAAPLLVSSRLPVFALHLPDMSSTLTQLAERVKARRELPSPAERRAVRRDAGLSAAELAEAIGVTEAAVLTWERGTREPRGRNLDRYVEALRTLREAAAA